MSYIFMYFGRCVTKHAVFKTTKVAACGKTSGPLYKWIGNETEESTAKLKLLPLCKMCKKVLGI